MRRTTGAAEIDFDLKVTANNGAWKLSLNLNLFLIPECKWPIARLFEGGEQV